MKKHFAIIFLAMLMLTALNPSKAYAPRIPGLLERVQQPLYDRNTVATSTTGQLNYFHVPLGESIPDSSASNGKPDGRGIYLLAEPIDLIPQQNFKCEINFPVSQSLSAGVDMSIYLDGFFKRELHGADMTAFGDDVGGTGGKTRVEVRDGQILQGNPGEAAKCETH